MSLSLGEATFCPSARLQFTGIATRPTALVRIYSNTHGDHPVGHRPICARGKDQSQGHICCFTGTFPFSQESVLLPYQILVKLAHTGHLMGLHPYYAQGYICHFTGNNL